MHLLRLTLVLTFFSFLSQFSSAQVTSIPELAKNSFATQYPNARFIEWHNDIVDVNVRFELDGEMMTAEYSNRGIWKRTLKDWSYDKLDTVVQDGFRKSKYADREVTEVMKLYLPGNEEQWRLKVEKNDFEKKFLYFNLKGRLLRTSVVL